MTDILARPETLATTPTSATAPTTAGTTAASSTGTAVAEQSERPLEGYFHDGLEQTVLPGPGLLLLDPAPRERYQSRLARAGADVAELYQVNARWRRGALDRLATSGELAELRSWFLESGRQFRDGALDDVPMDDRPHLDLASLPAPYANALHAISTLGKQAGLLYAADVLVAVNGWVHLLPAGSDTLVRCRRFDDSDLATLAGLVPAESRERLAGAEMVVFVSTVPWRVQVTHGERGYRNAILETGVLVAQVGQLLTHARLAAEVLVDFVDVAVDALLDQDGVEKFTTAVIPVWRPTAPEQSDANPPVTSTDAGAQS